MAMLAHPDPAAVDPGLRRAWRWCCRPGLKALANAGPHGFSEVLYAYTSATGNNGSAFAGLSAQHAYWNVTWAIAMLIGRFLMIIPMLAIAGSLAAKKIVPASAGTFPTDGGAVRRPADRRDPDHRRPDLTSRPMASARSSSTSRCSPAGLLTPTAIQMETVNTHPRDADSPACWIAGHPVPAHRPASDKLDPRLMIRNPVISGGGRGGPDHGPVPARSVHRRGQSRLQRSRSPCGCGSRCCSPTSPKPWPRAAARRRRPRCGRPHRHDGNRIDRQAATKPSRAPELKQGDIVLVERRGTDPQRRRGDRGHRLGRRVGDHRRIRAGDPRKRRRPLGGDRRHPRAVGLDQGAHHRRAGLDLPRPHDRAGGRRRTAEDAERDRAEHPAGRPDDHLRVRRGDHPQLCALTPAAPCRW